MHALSVRHKVTGKMYQSAPISLGGLNYVPTVADLMPLAINQMRRDHVVDVGRPDDYEFEVISLG